METTLPPAALPAWNAYLAMERGKQAHFQCLEALEKKYQDGGYRTVAETTELASLLAEHDHNVREFRAQIRQLAVRDIEAHQRLLEQITLWNTELGTDSHREPGMRDTTTENPGQ